MDYDFIESPEINVKKRKSKNQVKSQSKKAKVESVEFAPVKDWKTWLKTEPLLEDILTMVKELQGTTSSNKKLEILSRHPKCCKALFYTYNPFMQFHVSSKQCKAVSKRLELRKLGHNCKTIFQLLDMLHSGKISGNAALATVNMFISFNKKYEQLVYSMVDKNLQIRINATSINKVFPGMIPEFCVALAEKFEEGVLDFQNSDWYSSRKMDGVRVIAICKDPDDIRFFSREGKEFTTLKIIESSLRKLNLFNTVLDGEMCKIKSGGIEDFKAVVSEIKKKTGCVQNPRYHVFDILSLSDFDKKSSQELLVTRQKKLVKTIGTRLLPYVQLVEQKKVESDKDIEEQLENCKEMGWEGLILRKNAHYDGSRSKDMLKVKSFQTEEFIVQDIEISNMRFVIDKKDTEITCLKSVVILLDDEHKVNVGSGFSREEREFYAANPGEIIGKTIAVSYFEKTRDKKGNPSLRFPTFKAIYDDERDI